MTPLLPAAPLQTSTNAKTCYETLSCSSRVVRYGRNRASTPFRPGYARPCVTATLFASARARNFNYMAMRTSHEVGVVLHLLGDSVVNAPARLGRWTLSAELLRAGQVSVRS